jgi:outer membrane immunogenic protein
MKRLLIAAGIFATSAGFAAAADMRMPVKAPPSAVAVYNWTGFYIGANAGYGWGDANTDGALTGTQNVSVFRTAGPDLMSSVTTIVGPLGYNVGRMDVDGFIGGGQVGYNWQVDRSWVLGIEADFQGSAQKGSATGCSIATCAVGSAFLTVEQKLEWFGTLRGRVGWLVTDRVMLYGTGGLAYGHLKTNFAAGINGIGAAAAAGSSSTQVGWTAGAGVEGAIDRNWTVKLEYLYVDLGNFGNGSSSATFVTNQLNTPLLGQNTVTTTTFTNTLATKFTDHILRAGINYRF